MTSAIKHEACVNPAVDAFDSSVYSQGHTFKAFPVRIKSDNRPEASIYRERKVEPPMFFFGAWSPQGIFLQLLYDVHGMSKRARYSMAR
jgi:hypothetical protein